MFKFTRPVHFHRKHTHTHQKTKEKVSRSCSSTKRQRDWTVHSNKHTMHLMGKRSRFGHLAEFVHSYKASVEQSFRFHVAVRDILQGGSLRQLIRANTHQRNHALSVLSSTSLPCERDRQNPERVDLHGVEFQVRCGRRGLTDLLSAGDAELNQGWMRTHLKKTTMVYRTITQLTGCWGKVTET